jgi:hypothetical protein
VHFCAQSLSMTALRLAALMAWSAMRVHGSTHLPSAVLQWSLVAARHRTAWTMAGLSSSYGGVYPGACVPSSGSLERIIWPTRQRRSRPPVLPEHHDMTKEWPWLCG